ncbi:translation initiation factor IF-2, partial [Pyramidobacter porci]
YGLVSEAWGGDTVMVEISAKSGKGVDQLLEMISLVAEMQDLKADPAVAPEGVVIEARLDKGQGAVASVIVQQGTLCRGDLILFDSCWGKVRAMFNDAGKNVKQAGPSTAVEIIGLNGVPQPGEHFHQIGSEKEARDYFANLEAERRNAQNNMAVKRMTLEDLYSQVQDGEKPVLNLVIKCDVQGTIEAIVGSLEKLGTEDVGINIVHTAVGRISESDIMLATASNAIVVGFNVRPENSASKLAEKENVQIRLYSIIYEIIDDVKAAMEGLLTPTIKENSLGEAEIRKIFKAPKVGKIAGCRVMKGAIKRGSKVRLVRDGIVIWEGSVASLRREKDEASEVREGFECGMTFTNYQDFREGDVVEAYELVEEKRTL